MSQEPQVSGMPPDEEKLSGTFAGGLQRLASALGGLSTTFVLVGTVGLVLGVVLIIFLSELRLYSYIILGIGGISLLLATAISFETVSRAITGRRGRYSTNTTIMVVAFLGIAAVVNYLAFENSARIDVTATKQFSLAPRTVELLKDLKAPVEAKAFFGPASSPAEEAFQNELDNLLKEFKVRSGEFSYEFVDPDLNPLVAREYGIDPVTGYGNIVFESVESRNRHLVSPSRFLEQDFVTGLLIITGQEQKRVYFLSGHGEKNILDVESNTEGFGFAIDGIVGENYLVSEINLSLSEGKETLKRDRCEVDQVETAQQEDPDTEPCKEKVNMLVVAGPTKDLLEGEVEILEKYLKNGGNMLFLLEPGTPTNWRDFLARWGIVVREGHIVDKQRSASDNNAIPGIFRDQYFTVLPEPFSFLGISQMTSRLDVTYYPGVTALEPAEGVIFFPSKTEGEEDQLGEGDQLPTIFGTALARTSGESWLIKDPARNETKPGDLKDIFFPAVAVKAIAPVGEELPTNLADVKTASIVVFGDSDFASNRFLHTASNRDFFLNSINWLVGDIALADIRPKPLAFRELVLTRNEEDFMRYSSWFLLPVLMAIMGGLVWWRRR